MRKIGFWAQLAVTYFIVSGGPYGIEAAVGSVGGVGALLLVLLVPVFWALPTALVVAELGSMMPDSGGYYTWVRKALGPFWGFQEGWWTLCYSAVDLAIYPVLFVTYLSYFWPAVATDARLHWLSCACFVVAALLVNLRGAPLVARHKMVEIVLVLLPFVALTIFGLWRGHWVGFASEVGHFQPSRYGSEHWATAVAVLLWNYTGWDNATTYSEEIAHPERTIPRAVLWCLLLVAISYLFPLLAGLAVTSDVRDWAEGSGWPQVAAIVGGPVLGTTVAAVAVLSAWALFNSQLLYISRLPMVMAKDGVFPKKFAAVRGVSQSPYIALVVAGIFAFALSGISLGKLMVADMLLYSLGLALEYVALFRLRKSQPKRTRPFRIPLGTKGLLLMAMAPCALIAGVAFGSLFGDGANWWQLAVVFAVVASGLVLAYRLGLLRPKR